MLSERLWGDAEKVAFQGIKLALASAATLAQFDGEKSSVFSQMHLICIWLAFSPRSPKRIWTCRVRTNAISP